MIFSGGVILLAVLLALAIDAIFGEPEKLWRRFPHPVVWFGRCISICDEFFNASTKRSEASRKLAGLLTILLLVVGWGVGAVLLQKFLLSVGLIGTVVLAFVGSTLIAQKSLYDHVHAVEVAVASGNIGQARHAVSMIVGRDPSKLDQSGVSRAAIESLAENFSDGVVAPVFWFMLFGLPGLVVYKVVNTADSMIGHKNEKYEQFGWASARLDDALNLVPARLTMLLLLYSPFSGSNGPYANAQSLWEMIKRDAPKHRSPNAGWPETAMAGRLGIALSGPRYYDDKYVEEPFVNAQGRRLIGAVEISDALRLFKAACIVEAGAILLLSALL